MELSNIIYVLTLRVNFEKNFLARNGVTGSRVSLYPSRTVTLCSHNIEYAYLN